MISRFMAAAAAGEPVTVYGDGHQTRDFVYVGDVVEAIVRAASEAPQRRLDAQRGFGYPDERPGRPGPPGGARGRPHRAALRARARRRHPRLARRRRARRAGCSAGRPHETFADGLAETWAWYRDGPESLRRRAGARMPSARRIMVGRVPVGGGAPVAVQSMTCTRTGDAAATLAQVRALVAAGCELVRVSLPTAEEATAFAPRRARGSPVPIIADIHYDWRLALAAIEAGAAGIRINPGTMAENARREIVRAAGRARASPATAPRRQRPPSPSASASTPARCRATCATRPSASPRRRSSRPRCAGRRGSTSGASSAYKLTVKSSSVPVDPRGLPAAGGAHRGAAARGRHRGRHRVERHASRAPWASARCSPRASATPCACR